MIMSFLMESCKPATGQNKNEKQANNARWTSGELLGRQFYALEFLQRPYPSWFPLSNQDQGMNDVKNKSSWFWHFVPW